MYPAKLGNVIPSERAGFAARESRAPCSFRLGRAARRHFDAEFTKGFGIISIPHLFGAAEAVPIQDVDTASLVCLPRSLAP